MIVMKINYRGFMSTNYFDESKYEAMMHNDVPDNIFENIFHGSSCIKEHSKTNARGATTFNAL